jgi:hypothetical protein
VQEKAIVVGDYLVVLVLVITPAAEAIAVVVEGEEVGGLDGNRTSGSIVPVLLAPIVVVSNKEIRHTGQDGLMSSHC